uniref:Uncharacterized protein n=1 Tax=Oryza glumipatula TaxID=40148 RepID=A0A0D9Z039_9ORYZ
MGSNSCMLFIEYTSVKSSVEMNKPMINFQCQLCTCIANANNAADSFSVGSEELLYLYLYGADDPSDSAATRFTG